MAVISECLEDIAGGVFWEVAFDGDTVAKPCRTVDERFRYVGPRLRIFQFSVQY